MNTTTIIANWKMNGSAALVEDLCAALVAWQTPQKQCNVVICPPFPYISMVSQALFDSEIAVGAQDCHTDASGAFTGNVSASMLADTGCSYVIVGHSERRQHHAETDGYVKLKALAAIEAGLIPVVCVGESLTVREAGSAIETVVLQAKNSAPIVGGQPAGHFILAYEPIWAIGSGKIPSMDDIADMHRALKSAMHEACGKDVVVLYGGSVQAGNAGEILGLEGVNGALVGGASLKAESFTAILNAAG